jgi:hypothetical protein
MYRTFYACFSVTEGMKFLFSSWISCVHSLCFFPLSKCFFKTLLSLSSVGTFARLVIHLVSCIEILSPTTYCFTVDVEEDAPLKAKDFELSVIFYRPCIIPFMLVLGLHNE